MKTFRIIFFLLPWLTFTQAVFSQNIIFISPRDSSNLVSVSTSIIIKSDKKIDPTSLSPDKFSVTGSTSGIHEGIVRLSEDARTVLLIPSSSFAANEDVSVNVSQGMRTTDGDLLPPVRIQFKTSLLSHPLIDISQSDNGTSVTAGNIAAAPFSLHKNSGIDTVPSNFPQIVIGTSNDPAPGNIFIANESQTANKSIGNFLMILNNNGSVAQFKELTQDASLFKIEANGEPSFNYKGNGERINMDTALTPVDTINCGNGYGTDGHDGLLLPNGHSVLFASDPEPVDMSKITPGGSPEAIVTGLIVQELDASKNVIFQWRTWDYLPIIDSYFDLTSQNVDLIHGNALAVDLDGNILVSMRHLSSIVKINHETGDVMWILGGKQNQFTFLNEHASNAPTYFSYQHNISVLPNGNFTLFDNGNQHSPNYSRGVEYKLDVPNKTATLVWEYRHTPDIYTNAMGSVERLSNGNTVIGWGIAPSQSTVPVCTEVHPDNSTALELSLPAGQFSYRAYKYPWVSQKPNATVSVDILPGNTYSFNSTADTTGIKITFRSLTLAYYAGVSVTSYPYAPVNPTFSTQAPLLCSNYFTIAGAGFGTYTGDVQVALANYPAVINPRQTIIYARTGIGSNFTPLPTSFDSVKNVLTFSTSILGDFAFGIPQTTDTAYTPFPISPADSEIVNESAPVKLVWGTRGIVQAYHVQVATDASFNNLVVDNASLNTTSITLNSVSANTTYYWRVNTTNTAGTSTWTNPQTFKTAAPYIAIVSPNGGEKIYLDSVSIIRWESNTSDPEEIDLINGSTIISVISDSVVSGTHAFRWQLAANLQTGPNYKIKVISRTNSSLFGESSSPFTISSNITGVSSSSNDIVKSYELFQNYPNPYNPSTTIRFGVPQRSTVRLTIYNILGQVVAELFSGTLDAGYFEKVWSANVASGMYFYRFEAVSVNNPTVRFIDVKKMTLLK